MNTSLADIMGSSHEARSSSGCICIHMAVADQMAADNIPCLCRNGPGHCKNDKRSSSHRTEYDQFVPAQNQHKNK